MSKLLPKSSFESTEGIRDRLEIVLSKYIKETAEWLCYEGLYCESPIEGLMAACFGFRKAVYPNMRVEPGLACADLVSFINWVEMMEAKEIFPRCIYVGQQIQLSDRRVDFLAHFRAPQGAWYLAIECDGHEYHILNKTQAAKDRRTDRAILIGGIPTMRFTGSEIWADAMRCVDEVIEYFWNRYRAAISGEVKAGAEEEAF